MRSTAPPCRGHRDTDISAPRFSAVVSKTEIVHSSLHIQHYEYNNGVTENYLANSFPTGSLQSLSNHSPASPQMKLALCTFDLELSSDKVCISDFASSPVSNQCSSRFTRKKEMETYV
jgi:hypothetical protein